MAYLIRFRSADSVESGSNTISSDGSPIRRLFELQFIRTMITMQFEQLVELYSYGAFSIGLVGFSYGLKRFHKVSYSYV